MNRSKNRADNILFLALVVVFLAVAFYALWSAGYRTGQQSVPVKPEIITACVQVKGQEQECE